jgi:pimeloyl-ACP methyl ester carboxylesterase
MTSEIAAIRVPTPQGLVSLGTIREHTALQFCAESLRQLDLDVLTPLIAGRWLDNFDYGALWTRASGPVLLLQGDPNAGGAFSDVDLTVARARLANSHHVRFHGIGHQIHNTCPDQVLTELNRFAFS